MTALSANAKNDGLPNDDERDFLAAADEFFKLISQGLTPEEAMEKVKSKHIWL